MHKTRLEAFSDAVIAIVLTIMVLELKVPHHGEWASLKPVLPKLASYILSFVYLGIYWNNHHHLLQAAECVNGRILWANMHLLFWLSLVPFGTEWMGENGLAAAPVALYGAILMFCGSAYYILTQTLIQQHGKKSKLAKAIGADLKGKLSLGFYAVAIVAAYFFPWLSIAIYINVALMWLIPDRRIEKALEVEGCEP